MVIEWTEDELTVLRQLISSMSAQMNLATAKVLVGIEAKLSPAADAPSLPNGDLETFVTARDAMASAVTNKVSELDLMLAAQLEAFRDNIPYPTTVRNPALDEAERQFVRERYPIYTDAGTIYQDGRRIA